MRIISAFIMVCVTAVTSHASAQISGIHGIGSQHRRHPPQGQIDDGRSQINHGVPEDLGPNTGPQNTTITATTLAVKGLSTTGSISAGSSTLTLASDPGFNVGDNIIIEIGGEGGAGQRGTFGVGGTWPAKNYARVAAMNADITQPANTYAWVTASGQIYQFVSGSWITPPASQYYISQAVPRALLASITAKSGVTLTLNKSAAVASTNANVYYDNAPYLNSLFNQGSGFSPISNKILFPSGSFAIGSSIEIQAHNNWSIVGQGKASTIVFSPKGTDSAQFYIFQASSISISNMQLKGNARFQGFGLGWSLGFVTETNIAQGNSLPLGFYFISSPNGNVSDCTVYDVFQDAVGTEMSNNVWAERVDAHLSDGLQQYVQWIFQWADSTGGGCIDCSVSSPILTAGFESFRSNGVQFIRPVGSNATFSLNSSGNWIVDAYQYTGTSMNQLSENSFSSSNPIVNINSNIQPPDPSVSNGGTFENFTIIQQGYINTNNDRLTGISVNAQNPNVVIQGKYPAKPNTAGLIQAPDYIGPGDSNKGAQIVSNSAVAVTVTGVRTKGAMLGQPTGRYGQVTLQNAGSSMRNSVFDLLVGSPAQSANQTNSQYCGGVSC